MAEARHQAETGLGHTDRAHKGGRAMFRMIFAIVIGVMEKTPRRERRHGA